MGVGITKILNTKVPSTLGTLVAGGLITNGLHDLTVISTKVIMRKSHHLKLKTNY